MRGYKTAGILLALSVSICSLTGCGEKKKEADFSGIASVCELATLKCYYHNVAKGSEMCIRDRSTVGSWSWELT